MDKMKYKDLILEAEKAKTFSYSPYSKFRVGAALLTKSGKIFSGCNVENGSYSLTICAERTAVFKAVSAGEREFKAIAITSDLSDFCSPCGACRQVLHEFSKNMDVILVNGKKTKIYKIKDFLPLPFKDNYLK
jgi:cytidine deaminase